MRPVLDGLARRLLDPPLNRVARRLVRLGLRANTLTLLGVVAGAGACLALGAQRYDLALVGIGVSRALDGLDGPVARHTPGGATDFGGYLDSVCDTAFYGGIPVAFAAGRPECVWPALVLVYSFAGTGAAFLAHAAISAKRGHSGVTSRGSKSFAYAAGLMEGAETIAFFAAFCLLPGRFAELAYAFAALCWLTVLARLIDAYYAFGPAGKRP